jgi:hypothetical protein
MMQASPRLAELTSSESVDGRKPLVPHPICHVQREERPLAFTPRLA